MTPKASCSAAAVASIHSLCYNKGVLGVVRAGHIVINPLMVTISIEIVVKKNFFLNIKKISTEFNHAAGRLGMKFIISFS